MPAAEKDATELSLRGAVTVATLPVALPDTLRVPEADRGGERDKEPLPLAEAQSDGAAESVAPGEGVTVIRGEKEAVVGAVCEDEPLGRDAVAPAL